MKIESGITTKPTIQIVAKSRKIIMQSEDLKIFTNKHHKVILGDAITALKEIPNETIDLIFVDPPYNIGKDFNGYKDKWDNDQNYIEWCYQWLALCIKKIKPNGSLYVMTSTQFMPYYDIFLQSKLNILSRIVLDGRWICS